MVVKPVGRGRSCTCPYTYAERLDRLNTNLDAHLVLGFGQLHSQGHRIKVVVGLIVDPHLADANTAGRQDVGRDAQDVALEAVRVRLEVCLLYTSRCV